MKNYDELTARLSAGTGGGRHWMDLHTEAATVIQELQDERDTHARVASRAIDDASVLKTERKLLAIEHAEQSRLLGISGSREAALIAEVDLAKSDAMRNAVLAVSFKAERDVLQSQIDKLSSWAGGGIEVSVDAWRLVHAERDEYQQEVDKMAAGHKVERDNLQYELSVLKEKHCYTKAGIAQPVAWVIDSPHFEHPIVQILKPTMVLSNEVVYPLYAAGAAPQPLTDERIQEIYVQTYMESHHRRDFETAFARSIEAAHGIAPQGEQQ